MSIDFVLQIQEPIAPQLFRALRDAIVYMKLRPGEALSEKEVAQRFGISRQPVREAFIKLSEAGLVQIRPSRGTFVRKISVREVADARFVREAVECSLVQQATRLATPADIDQLKRIVEEQKQAANHNDFMRFNSLDETFHRTIAGIVGCRFAQRTVESARNQVDRVRFLSLGHATPMKRLIAQHRLIVTSISEHDAETATATLRTHLREILLALPDIASTHPDLFEDHSLPLHSQDIDA